MTYLELMPYAAKPKLHYMLHTAACLQAHGANFSCFPGERLLSIPKSLGKDCYRDFARSLTKRVLKKLMENFADEVAYEENIIIKPKPDATVKGMIFQGVQVADGFKGLSASTTQGSFKRNDIVCWRDPTVRLGRARLYYDLRMVDGVRRVVGKVGPFPKLGDAWKHVPPLHSHACASRQEDDVWIDMNCIRTVTCVLSRGMLYPRFPFGAF